MSYFVMLTFGSGGFGGPGCICDHSWRPLHCFEGAYIVNPQMFGMAWFCFGWSINFKCFAKEKDFWRILDLFYVWREIASSGGSKYRLPLWGKCGKTSTFLFPSSSFWETMHTSESVKDKELFLKEILVHPKRRPQLHIRTHIFDSCLYVVKHFSFLRRHIASKQFIFSTTCPQMDPCFDVLALCILTSTGINGTWKRIYWMKSLFSLELEQTALKSYPLDNFLLSLLLQLGFLLPKPASARRVWILWLGGTL